MQKASWAVLSNLREVREKPPSLYVFVNPEGLDPANSQSNQSELQQMEGEINMAADNIDWDIALDSSQIDWDIGNVGSAEETDGLGPYEMINASDVSNSPRREVTESAQPSVTKEEAIAPGVPVSEISWDISIENPEVSVIEESGFSVAHIEPHLIVPHPSSEAPDRIHERSPLLETDYRNRILDDLFEVNMLSEI